MTTYSINITDNYEAPTTSLDSNEAYVTFVMNMAAMSYATQYGTATSEEGITAAREAFNASLPAPTEDPV
jgi:hypothetical protein